MKQMIWLIVSILLFFPTLNAKTPSEADRYTTPAKPHPQSIGKAYMGREIAKVMGYSGVDWLERSNREQEERISQLIDALPLRSGMQLADIGAGSGVLSLPMAKKLLPDGQVLAVEIQKPMLKRLVRRAREQKITNVRPVLGSISSPNLAPGSIDLVLMVDVYHEFSHPYEMLLEISKALKPGGLIALVEYRAEDPKVPIKELHKMSLEQIRKEFLLPEFQLEWLRLDSRLPLQHLVFLQKSK